MSIADAVTKHIQKKWEHDLCPRCRARSWAVHGPFLLRLHQTTDLRWGEAPAGLPTLLLICLNCGYTELLNSTVVDGAEPVAVTTQEGKKP